MKITLIRPPIIHKDYSFTLTSSPPIGLAYIAGTLKYEGHNIDVIDCSAEGHKYKKKHKGGMFLFGLDKETTCSLIHPKTEIICISLMFTNNWLYDKELINYIKLKFPRAIIIVGGEHATAAPEMCFKQSSIDYIVYGEGELSIKELVSSLSEKKDVKNCSGIYYINENGEIKKTPNRTRVQNIENIPWPAWELFPVNKYFENKMSHGVYLGNTLPVLATRGCPYTCTFCSNPKMWGKKYEMRPPSDFVDELEYLNKKFGVINFDLYDLTAIIVKEWIIEMCQEIIKRGLKITYQLPAGTRAEAIDFEVATYLVKSGCKNITYAPESGSKKVLKDVKKKVNIDKMLHSIDVSSKAGLNIKLNMIIGFPEETHLDIWKTIFFLIKCSWYGANDAAPAIFSPYPGSQLYETLKNQGKIKPYSDDYILEIISSNELWPKKIYSEKISPNFIRIYSFLLLIIFYSSNYIFRPIRFFKTVRNIVLNKSESRLEQIIIKNFIANLSLSKR